VTLRLEQMERYAGGRATVVELTGLPAGEVEPDEHAHHAANGATYTHGHRSGSVPHAHAMTVEWDGEACDWRPVALSPDEPPRPAVERGALARAAALAADAPNWHEAVYAEHHAGGRSIIRFSDGSELRTQRLDPKEGLTMGHSPDAYLFYGYNLPGGVEVPDTVADTFCSGRHEVRLGHSGYEFDADYLHWRDSERRADDYGVERVDLASLLADLPSDVDDRIRAFAAEHGLPLPGEKVDPDDEYQEPAGELGWWLAAHYG
jgi:hypothetical protein